MPKFNVHLTETRHYIIPVHAADSADAKRKAMDEWRDAPTVGQWEVAETETDILSAMQPVETR